MSDRPLSQSRLATYAKCPRLYEFQYDWDVAVPDEQRRYFERGNVLHEAIEHICERVDAEPGLEDSEIRQLAIDQTNRNWDERMDRSEYYSDAEFEEDRLATVARIEAFFDDGPGFGHVRNSIATELYVSLERNDETYHGYIDNVVRDDGTLTLVDYKTSSVKPPFTRQYVKEHLEDGYRPRRVKPAMQAALYLEAIKTADIYDPALDLEFVFYELRKSRGKTVTRRPGEVTVTVEGRARNVTSGYHEQAADVWELIEKCATGIRAEEYEPESFEEIYDNTCSSCDFRNACPQYLEEEVSRL